MVRHPIRVHFHARDFDHRTLLDPHLANPKRQPEIRGFATEKVINHDGALAAPAQPPDRLHVPRRLALDTASPARSGRDTDSLSCH